MSSPPHSSSGAPSQPAPTRTSGRPIAIAPDAYGEQPGPHAPVIVITAAGPGALRSAEHLGTISAVLAKPLNLDELHEIIALHLNRSA